MISKRRLQLLMRQMHGEMYEREFVCIPDERGQAAVIIARFDPEIAAEMATYRPVHDVCFALERENKLDAAKETIRILLEGWKEHLEYVEVECITYAVGRGTRHLFRALAKSRKLLAHLPQLKEIVVDDVAFSDADLEAVCSNPRIESLDLRGATITRRALDILKRRQPQRHVLISRCPKIPRSLNDEWKRLLPKVKTVRIT